MREDRLQRKHERQRQKEKFGFECGYCGDRPEHLTIDHFVPLSKGGYDGASNWVPSCLRCNGEKSDQLPLHWYKKQSFFSEERWRKILKILGLMPS